MLIALVERKITVLEWALTDSEMVVDSNSCLGSKYRRGYDIEEWHAGEQRGRQYSHAKDHCCQEKQPIQSTTTTVVAMIAEEVTTTESI